MNRKGYIIDLEQQKIGNWNVALSTCFSFDKQFEINTYYTNVCKQTVTLLLLKERLETVSWPNLNEP